MDNKVGVTRINDDDMELPPGFRFHPTDEELITHYLLNKVIDSTFSALPIGEVDMNQVEPWELPWRGKVGEKEWYFFCVRDKKYPSGQRTNRATAAGYWKATGKDKQIFRGEKVVGMKKTLVFYKGRAPNGQRSNWVAHEYRLEGHSSLPNSAKNEWVISRVFKKTSGGQKIHISALTRTISQATELNSSKIMPPLIDWMKLEVEPGHVHCFSEPVTTPQKIQDDSISYFMDPIFPDNSISRLIHFQDSDRELWEGYELGI